MNFYQYHRLLLFMLSSYPLPAGTYDAEEFLRTSELAESEKQGLTG